MLTRLIYHHDGNLTHAITLALDYWQFVLIELIQKHQLEPNQTINMIWHLCNLYATEFKYGNKKCLLFLSFRCRMGTKIDIHLVLLHFKVSLI